MTTNVFAADVSRYQVPVDGTYKRKWLIFRIGDGSMDPNARANLAWCKKALADGRMLGYTGYLVYRPGETPTHLLDELGFPTDRHVMLDVESWGGQIGGNRSSELNALAAQIRARQGGDSSRVWGYGNQNDLTNLWPNRPAWMRLVVARYSTFKPNLTPLAGWQYTDGESKWAVLRGWPRSSKPFGHCDHNRLYLSEEDISMPLTKAEITAIGDEVLNRTAAAGDGKRHPIWWFLTGGYGRAVSADNRAGVAVELVKDLPARVADCEAKLETVIDQQEKILTALNALAEKPVVSGDLKLAVTGELDAKAAQ